MITDHLGNTRLVYSDIDEDGVIDVPGDIIQENHYYPFGMRMKGPWMGSQDKYKYKYNSIEEEQDFGLNLNFATFRTLDPSIGRWMQVDPRAESTYGLTPYGSMNQNPISNVDPEGDIAFLAALGYAAISVGTNGIINEATGGSFFDNWGSAAVSGFFAGGPWAAAANGASGHLPSANIGLGGGFSIGLSPSFAIGSGSFNVGANASLNYQNGDFGFGIGAGTSYGKNGVTGATGFESRIFGGASYDNGDFGASIASTTFFSGETSQRVGTLGLRSGDFSFIYDNDNIPGVGDLYDRFRTSAVSLGYRGYSLGLQMFTGDPRPYSTEEVNGVETYTGPNADKYRQGALFVGYGNTRIGTNSENIRHLFQNQLIHTGIAKPFGAVPHFRKLNSRWHLYGGSFTTNPYSLWY